MGVTPTSAFSFLSTPFLDAHTHKSLSWQKMDGNRKGSGKGCSASPFCVQRPGGLGGAWGPAALLGSSLASQAPADPETGELGRGCSHPRAVVSRPRKNGRLACGFLLGCLCDSDWPDRKRGRHSVLEPG